MTIGNEKRAKDLLLNSDDHQDHMAAREYLNSNVNYIQYILDAYLANPFLRLTEEEGLALRRKVRPVVLGDLITAREAATRSPTPKYVIFCMPKSGSSFVKSALEYAFELPSALLTGFSTARASSKFGMNSREQELDEAAIIKSSILFSNGFVAQHHTRYSPYLARQVNFYGLTPILMIRNILDCIVSFDDMMVESRNIGSGDWIFDPQFPLPIEYKDLDDDDRYTLLSYSFGVWLINFYLSWVRAGREQRISPLVIRYEDHILDRQKLIELLSGYVSISDEQQGRLRDYLDKPNKNRSRFNVGQRGRGEERIPEHLKDFLADYARRFRSELTDDDIRYLVR